MKKTIIFTSIICAVIASIAVLFGAIFCLRNQRVTFLDDGISYEKQDILLASGLKNGEPIFMIDKDTAISNIESSFPDLKVVQIVTTDVMSIDIRVRSRYATYYVEIQSEDSSGVYYVLDEELKILEVVGEEPTHLVKINQHAEGDHIAGDFIINDKASLMTELYKAIYTTKLLTTSTGAQAHIDMCELVSNVSFDKDYTLSGEYDRLLITLRSGVIIDIGRPASDLENKMNVCFTAIDQYLYTTGRVRVYYNKDNVELHEYFEN